MKNISSEVDYIGKSDVCRDGTSLLTLVTGVGENNNHSKIDCIVNVGLMATSKLSVDGNKENDVLKDTSVLKEAAEVACNGGFHLNGVVSGAQHYPYLAYTWPGRPNNNHHNSYGKYKNEGVEKSSLEKTSTQQNGHHNCEANIDNDVLETELQKLRKMVRSASMDNFESPEKYKLELRNGINEMCEGLENENLTDTGLKDLSAFYRRASDPLNVNQPRPLSAVLESIPLAYNPQTKQLHLLSSKSKTSSFGNCPSQCNNCSNLDSSCKTVEIGKVGVNKLDASYNTDNAHNALLQRVSTCGSLQSKADCSSFSSISSLCTDLSVSTASALEDNYNEGAVKGSCSLSTDGDDTTFIEINLNSHHHHRNRSGERCNDDGDQMNEQCQPGQGVKLKRRGLTGFLSRNLLSWRSFRDSNVGAEEGLGWKLFGKTSPRSPALSNPNRIIEEYHERQFQTQTNCTESPVDCSTPRSKRSDDLVASSTTALILENRPLNLPSKAPEEEVKHRLEYQQMVEAAKKKEIKEAKLKKKLAQQQLRHEEQLSQAAKCWNVEILPNWESAKSCRKAKKLWWQGIPPSVRGKVWKLAIGNDLHITPELYEICVCRAKDRIRMAAESISVSEDDFEENLQDKESSVELIKLDVSRTFPQLCIFQKRGPCYDMLHSLLGAYVCYRPDVGYVQGMSFLAAVLILNLEVADAFICFANLMNKPCQLAFFRLDEQMMRTYFITYEEYFNENLPKLFNHFSKQNLTPDLYLIDWIYTLYSRSLPLDVACRVWDVYFRDGDEFLFRTALGILRLYDDILLNMEFIHLAQFLTKLPEDIGTEQLFKSIESIRMVIDKRSFAQVLQSYSEPKQT